MSVDQQARLFGLWVPLGAGIVIGPASLLLVTHDMNRFLALLLMYLGAVASPLLIIFALIAGIGLLFLRGSDIRKYKMLFLILPFVLGLGTTVFFAYREFRAGKMIAAYLESRPETYERSATDFEPQIFLGSMLDNWIPGLVALVLFLLYSVLVIYQLKKDQSAV